MLLNEIKNISDLEYIIWRALETKRIKNVYGTCRFGCSLKKIVVDESGAYAAFIPAYEFEPTPEDERNARLFFRIWIKLVPKQTQDLVIKKCQGYDWAYLESRFGSEQIIRPKYKAAMQVILNYIQSR